MLDQSILHFADKSTKLFIVYVAVVPTDDNEGNGGTGDGICRRGAG